MTLDIQVGAELQAWMRDTTTALDRVQRAINRPPAIPVFTDFIRSAAANASGIAVIGTPRVEQGRLWYVRSIKIGGTDPTVTVAGTADFYTTSTPPGILTQAQLGLADWEDRATSMPAVQFYATGAIVVHPTQHLTCIVSGGTNGVTYQVKIRVEEIEEGSIGQVFDL